MYMEELNYVCRGKKKAKLIESRGNFDHKKLCLMVIFHTLIVSDGCCLVYT